MNNSSMVYNYEGILWSKSRILCRPKSRILCTKTGFTLLRYLVYKAHKNAGDSSAIRTLFTIDWKDQRFLSEPYFMDIK